MTNKEDVLIDVPSQWTGSLPNGKTYLLIIAIDQYRNGITPLSNAVRDAQAVAQNLFDHYELEEKDCKMLIDEKATKKNIIKTLDEYLALVTNEDNLLFYFSGHGYFHAPTKRGYWLTADSISQERDTFFSNDEVISFARHLKARHVFGMVDSCFSAALFHQKDANPITSRRYNIPSRWLLTAGRLEPVSDGRAGEHSPFAKTLLTQLAYPENPYLWVSELCNKVLDGIKYESEKQLPRGQPLDNAGNQGGEFVLLRKGQVVPVSTPLPPVVPPITAAPGPIHGKEKISPSSKFTIDLSGKSLDEIKDTIEEFVEEEDWKPIFDALKNRLARGNKRNILLQIYGRYNRLKNEEQRGTSTTEHITADHNKIRHALLTFKDGLKDRDLS